MVYQTQRRETYEGYAQHACYNSLARKSSETLCANRNNKHLFAEETNFVSVR